MMNPCRICCISTVQTSFWGSTEKQYESYYIPKLEQLSETLHFQLECIHEIVTSESEAVAVINRLDTKNIDFLLIQVSTFADGNIILPFADAGMRLGLWAVPEITKDGPIPNNSFCGINMYGSILHQYSNPELLYKWFYGDINHPLFIDRFAVTVRALTALKGLAGSKVALIGGIAPGFHDLYYDERQTKKRLGVTVNRLHEFEDIRSKAMSYSEEDIAPVITSIQEESTCIAGDMTTSGLDNTARAYKAFEDLVTEHGYDAIAISCWPKFRKEMGIVACAVIGRLLEHGIVAACEGDVDSAISMLLMKQLTQTHPMLMDMSKFDESDQSVLMWHCGSAPKWYADKNGVLFDGHYKPGSRVTCMDSIRVSGVNNMYYNPRPVTIARFTNNYENMFLLTGDFIDKEDHSFDGSRGWVGNLCIAGKPVDTRDLVNTVMVQGFQHHYPIVAGHIEDELREIMAWLRIAPLETVTYQPYLQASR